MLFTLLLDRILGLGLARASCLACLGFVSDVKISIIFGQLYFVTSLAIVEFFGTRDQTLIILTSTQVLLGNGFRLLAFKKNIMLWRHPIHNVWSELFESILGILSFVVGHLRTHLVGPVCLAGIHLVGIASCNATSSQKGIEEVSAFD